MNGFIHSIESFGTVDGPGIRFVIFLKGCPMRCIYCHNPDTWSIENASILSSDELIKQYNKNKAFYKNGGITITGGEPLMQIDFVIDLFKKAKSENIHTCLDTSGICFNKNDITKYQELIKYTDLVMLDIKHIDNESHKNITGKENTSILEFAKFLDENNIPMYIRHVVLENYTDNPEDLMKLGEFIGSLKNVKALDVLPFHNLGKKKYESLNIPYKLKDYNDLTKQQAKLAKDYILKGIKKYKESKVV